MHLERERVVFPAIVLVALPHDFTTEAKPRMGRLHRGFAQANFFQEVAQPAFERLCSAAV
jgi:hypothetical protein